MYKSDSLQYNVCLIKIRSKHSSNTLLSLLRFFMRQTLVRYTVLPYNDVLQYKCRSDVLQIKEIRYSFVNPKIK